MNFIDPAGKLLYHIDRIAEIGQGKTPPPVNVEIDLSNRCNLGCKGCHMRQLHSRGPHAKRATFEAGDLMSKGLATSITQQLKDYGVRSITWTGGGEPLLHPDALEIFASCEIDQGLYTNGTQIDPVKAAVLKRLMKWVYVSLDRSDRATYLEYKGVDQFDRAADGIRALVRATGDATIGVGFLLDDKSWRRFYEMFNYAIGLGVNYVQFRPLIEPGKSTAWIKEFLNCYIPPMREGCVIDLDRFKMVYNWTGHPYPACYWAQMQGVITPDGRVWTCVNRRGFEGNDLGDLNKEPFSAIWERSGAYPVDDKCRMFCRGHLPNLTLNKILGDKPGHWRFV